MCPTEADSKSYGTTLDPYIVTSEYVRKMSLETHRLSIVLQNSSIYF